MDPKLSKLVKNAVKEGKKPEPEAKQTGRKQPFPAETTQGIL